MNDIKQYKPIALVFYIDWNWDRNALPLDESKREAFKKAIETSKMVELEWITINTFDIKEIRPAQATTELEKYFYSQSWQDRNYINQKTLRMAWQKVNTLEYRSWLWEQKAIERLQRMLEYHHEDLQPNSN
jgi:hypothetical protein